VPFSAYLFLKYKEHIDSPYPPDRWGEAVTPEQIVEGIVGKEIEGIVDTLRSKGVKFEHYDVPQLKREGDIYSAGNFKTVWFKDPDGNILSLVTG